MKSWACLPLTETFASPAAGMRSIYMEENEINYI